jgi:hypothetical protein
VDVTLLYFDGCPNWELTYARLREALAASGHPDQPITLRTVTTPEQAQAEQFGGSPTVLIDGTDPFADSRAAVGLTCRMFTTPAGLAGAPTVEQLQRALP